MTSVDCDVIVLQDAPFPAPVTLECTCGWKTEGWVHREPWQIAKAHKEDVQQMRKKVVAN